jgi:hypothetical protein
LTPEFLEEFLNFQILYEVHQVGSNEACSQNFSFLALNTAELAAPQISFKNSRQGRQRRVTDGFFSLQTCFTFRIYEIYKGKYWFHSKNFGNFFCSKRVFYR